MKNILVLLIIFLVSIPGVSASEYKKADVEVLNKLIAVSEKWMSRYPDKKDIYLEKIYSYKEKYSDKKRVIKILLDVENFILNYKKDPKLSHVEKVNMLNEVYKVVDNYFASGTGVSSNITLKGEEFDKIYVTLYKENDSTSLVFDMFYNRQKAGNYKRLSRGLEPGVHAIEIINSNRKAYYKSSVQIIKNYKLKESLEGLCLKVKLDKDCYEDDKTEFYVYRTISFKGNRDGLLSDLYRYNILVGENNIDNEKIKGSIKMAKDWFLNSINKDTDLLEYLYYPSLGEYELEDNNDIRQMASLWIMTEIDKFLGTKDFKELTKDTLDHYLSFIEEQDDYMYMDVDRTSIAHNAFTIMQLINVYDYGIMKDSEVDELLEGLADGIIAMQQDDGSFNTKFNMTTTSGSDFYPGESMLAFMKLYNHTNDERYLETTEKAFEYYREYWRENKNTAFIPWRSQVNLLLYQATKDKKYADFTFEMNDWILDFQVVNSRYPDKMGGFKKPRPGITTTSYMEGINDAYSLAVLVDDKEHIEKYKKSIRQATRFILQLQFTPENSFYLKDPSKAIGGFKSSLTNNLIRNDNVQHASASLMKIYNNNFFSAD